MINQIKFENFKCFASLDIEIAPLTLLTGINGVGKSSVIQSLLMLRQSSDTRYLQSEDKVLLNGELVNLINGDSIRYALSNTPEVIITILHGEKRKITSTIHSESSSDIVSANTTPIEELPLIPIFQESFLYLAAERLGPRTIYPKTQTNKHRGRLGLGSGELTASFLLSCLTNNSPLPIIQLKQPNEESDLIYYNVSSWLSTIAFDGTQISASDKNTDQIELKYSFNKGPLKGFDFSPLNVGFGFSYLLPIIVGILSAPKDSLILIENPESHLHPAAQFRVGQFIALAAMNGIQIILETHSDHILNGVRVAIKNKLISENIVKIIFFHSESLDNKINKQIEFLKIDKDGKIDQWPKDFFDTWEYSLMELM